MVRLVHTADWQIGKGYGNVAEEAACRLRQARIGAVDRVGVAAREFDAAYVVVAGDLWDSPTLPMETVHECFHAIGRVRRPVLVIPGNHDHGGSDGIWHRPEVQESQQRYAPNLRLLAQPEPVLLPDLVVLPCPLLRRHSATDSTAWLRSFPWDTLPTDRPRLVLAHGSVTNFGERVQHNVIDPDQLPTAALDYIALGDWHGRKQVGPKAWYCGTPEPDCFDKDGSGRRSQVLLVEVERGQTPRVTPHSTGHFHWHHLETELSGAEDLHHLQQQVDGYIGNRVRRDLLSMDLGHSILDFASHERYVEWSRRLREQLLVVVHKGSCTAVPAGDDLNALLNRPEDPLVCSVANQLQRRRLEGPDSEIASKALAELFRMVRRKDTTPQPVTVDKDATGPLSDL